MKKYILLILFAAIICFIAGCGPGQPFEIEEHISTQINVSAAR